MVFVEYSSKIESSGNLSMAHRNEEKKSRSLKNMNISITFGAMFGR